ncbi:MAG TPA: hypothetical protein VM737_08200 [Gemmatimonadota bacterium]|nr:hypothetical protein [Gemmatimonadota bacterium]
MTGVLLTLAGLWLLLGAVWLAVYPLLTRGGRAIPADAPDRRDLEVEKARLVAEIHELDLDRATGKLSEEDYRAIEQRLKARAVEVMREIDPRRG